MPPTIVRSLPPGQTLVYLNCRPLRELGMVNGGAQPSPSYAAFVRESGFDYQKDLDAVALSLNGRPTEPADATAILRGRFEPKFTAYLQRHALREERIVGARAYVFPGWARPQQLMTVVPLGPRELLVTNAQDAAPVVAQARRWWSAAPALWRAGNNWRLLGGYADINAEQLEAARALDGTQLPWQGVERVEVSLRGSSSGVTVAGGAQASSADAAAAVQQWVQSELDALRPLWPEEQGQPTLRALLDRVETGQNGRQVWLRLRVDSATLRAWTRRMQ